MLQIVHTRLKNNQPISRIPEVFAGRFMGNYYGHMSPYPKTLYEIKKTDQKMLTAYKAHMKGTVTCSNGKLHQKTTAKATTSTLL